MFKSSFAFLFFIASVSVFAQSVIRELHNSTQVMATVKIDDNYKSGDRVVIFASDRKNKPVAFGTIHDFHNEGDTLVAKIDITEILNNAVLRLDDEVVLLDHKTFRKRKVPGFNSVTLRGSHKIPAKYKELAYLGVFSAEGHTLDHDEILISPFEVQYGVTDNYGIKIVNALFFDGYANMGMKYRLANNKYAKFTVNGFGAYKTDRQDWIGQFGGILTIPSNAKFQTHWMANYTFDEQFEKAKATKGLSLYQDSEIRSVTEYITKNWNRVLFGPAYNVELQTFGGTISYMWIWDTFHMNAGIATRDFSNFHFGPKSYYYVYDFFWRF